MYQIKLLPILFFALCFSASSAFADLLLGDIDNTDLTMYSKYWEGNDTNPIDLNNNSSKAEENWLEALLGYEYNNPDINSIEKFEDGFPIGQGSFSNFDPGFDWDYAIIKSATMTYAYMDGPNADGLLSWNGSDPLHDVSYISFYSDNTPAPEPTTMILFGTGLAGLVGLRVRKKRIK